MCQVLRNVFMLDLYGFVKHISFFKGNFKGEKKKNNKKHCFNPTDLHQAQNNRQKCHEIPLCTVEDAHHRR